MRITTTYRKVGAFYIACIGLYATPEGVHTVSRNAWKTKPTRFVVFFIKDEGAPIRTPVHQLRTRAMYFPDETFFASEHLPYLEARMNSKAAQFAENGAGVACLFARFALGASFLSAVADRFGLWGPSGAKNVAWGDFAHFVEYTGTVMSLFPSSWAVSFAWASTVAETLFGILLIAGFKIRMVSILSGLLLLSFAMGMATGLGIKTPFDYSVFSAAAAAFLLASREPDRFTLDKLLNRSRN
jgi:uncharacterized membrane protein YphA (DoxX/SURF4 family)